MKSNSQISYQKSRAKYLGNASIDYSTMNSMGFKSLGQSEYKIKPYYNQTGPGDYNIPSFVGKSTNVGGRRNGPKFSFGSRPEKIQFFSEEYLRNFLGKESEDAAYSNVNMDALRAKQPSALITREARFLDPLVTRYK